MQLSISICSSFYLSVFLVDVFIIAFKDYIHKIQNKNESLDISYALYPLNTWKIF